MLHCRCTGTGILFAGFYKELFMGGKSETQVHLLPKGKGRFVNFEEGEGLICLKMYKRGNEPIKQLPV